MPFTSQKIGSEYGSAWHDVIQTLGFSLERHRCHSRYA